MEQFYLDNQTVATDQHTRPQLQRRDYIIWILATMIMAAITWYKVQPEPVLPAPGLAVLAEFCGDRP